MTNTPGLLQPLGDGLARLLAPNPSPFTGEGTWVHLIGTDRLVILDPGPADPAHLEALVAAIAGRPVDAILATAEEQRSDLIILVTDGADGFFDVLRGSTTQQIVRRAPCPVLAIPHDF